MDFDNDVDATDRAAVTNLTEEYGWLMPVASNTLRKVELMNDVHIPGDLVLSVTGTADIRVWLTADTTNDTPMLVTGQTVTNGVDGVYFVSYPATMLYVEAISSGTAALCYSYVGTGVAEDYSCSTELGMTVVNLKVEFISCGSECVTNALQVAKWEQTFTNGYNQVGSQTFTNALFRTPEFISADSDSFKIRITDENCPVKDTVSVRISTEHPYETTYDTPLRVLELQRTAPGVFVSTNLLLVSETNDNRQLTQDARSIIHEALISVTNTSDNICLVFAPSLRNQLKVIAGHATASYWYTRSADSAYTDHCLISVSQMTSFVSAHELCHVLNIRLHDTEKCNLMFPTTSSFNDVTSSKRLNTYQVDIISAGEL